VEMKKKRPSFQACLLFYQQTWQRTRRRRI
jgi:hypothetical protein